MFPTKVAGALFAVFATIGAVLFFHLSQSITQRTQSDLTDHLRIAHRSVDQARRLNDFALAARTSEVAGQAKIAAAFSAPREQFKTLEGALPTEEDYRYGIHRLMNEELAEWSGRFAALTGR